MPPYELTVTAQPAGDGAVLLGKTNLDEFAMGSSNMTSYYGPVKNPWPRPGDNRCAAGPRRLVGRLGRSGRRAPRAWRRPAPIPAARSASRPLLRHRRHQADLWPLLALGRSSPSPRRSTRPGRWPARSRTARSCCARWLGYDPKDSTSRRYAGAGFRAPPSTGGSSGCGSAFRRNTGSTACRRRSRSCGSRASTG